MVEEYREKARKCNQCGKVISNAGNLQTHMKTHSGEMSYKCNLCDYGSVRADHLKNHLKAHYGEKSYKCNQCDYASVQAVSLRTHLKSHSGQKSYKCNQCDFASAWLRSLRKHTIRNHFVWKPKKCNRWGSLGWQLKVTPREKDIRKISNDCIQSHLISPLTCSLKIL